MRVFTLQNEVWLPRPIGEVFEFFADAHNLETITPPLLRFEVLTPAPIRMETGTLIDYKLWLRGIPMRWQSEITAWEPPHRFVDEQHRGPYSMWVHEHTFEEKDGGTLARDHVSYVVPGGALVHKLFVARDVRGIFDYRTERLLEALG
jgi:ligand-binding SRPBCC domain-containing protein